MDCLLKKKVYTFFQKFLRSHFPLICKDFLRHFISHNIYITLSYIVTTRKLAEYRYVSEYQSCTGRSFRRYNVGFLVQRNLWLPFNLNILSTCLPILWKQKNNFEFSSTVYSRVNEVWNMILWNIIATYHFKGTLVQIWNSPYMFVFIWK